MPKCAIDFYVLTLTYALKYSIYFYHLQMLDTFLPGMKALNKGHVVSLSSMAGIVGLKNLVPYCASKFAVRGSWCILLMNL